MRVTRIADTPIGQIRFRIVRSGVPYRAPAGFPTIAWRPGFVAGLAGRRNRIEAPCLLASLCIVRVNEAAHRTIATGRSDDDLVLHHERRMRDAVPILIAFS